MKAAVLIMFQATIALTGETQDESLHLIPSMALL